MSEFNLDQYSLNELSELSKNIEKEIRLRGEKKKLEALAALEARAGELGFSLKELVAGKGKIKAAVSAPKYVHPENPSVTWTGRGRQPSWIKEGLASGKTLDDYKILS